MGPWKLLSLRTLLDSFNVLFLVSGKLSSTGPMYESCAHRLYQSFALPSTLVLLDSVAPALAELPQVLGPEECVERAVGRGHFRKADSSLKWQALRPRASEEGASVIRQIVGDSEVKHLAKIIKSDYVGLAETKVQRLRDAGLDAIDKRREGEFRGHAEIPFTTYPSILEPFEPQLAGEGNLEDINYYRSLVVLFKFRLDPDVEAAPWVAEPLCT